MNIKPIKSEQDYRAALARIDELWNAEPNTTAGDELEVWVTLVTAYEEKEFPIDAPDPIEAIRFRMEQLDLADKDLMPFLGTRSRVSEILNRKRGLSIKMIRSLHVGLRIPLHCLIQDYPLAD
ncbi:MAG: DNA-binding protein [Aliidiomarina sp.]|uniref:helix-turn-helix domain-containing protein n=1 Tax=Aliidiomarina sp. TaxID=1872439 RepID=UPI0025C585A2|nr:DNA-binding protein [Aliidiomarina sp.]MCH8502220.1 DNA-binding protein [Aliidiomarina sp.]